MKLIVATILLFLAVACTGNGDLESRVERLESDRSASVIVERVAEARFRDSGDWVPVGREVVTVAGGIAVVGTDNPVVARFRLTIRDSSLSPPTYEVIVPAECFDALSVGDAWPPLVLIRPACR